MTDLPDLLHAVIAHPDETVPVAMLADWLIERGDGRGEVLRRWLGMDPKPAYYHRTFHGLSDYASHTTGGEVSLQADVGRGLYEFVGMPVFNLRVGGRACERFRYFISPVPLSDARRIADAYPNADAVHAFLDRHFGR